MATHHAVLSEDRLRAILEGTAASTGASFFQSTVRHFAQALQVKYAFVAQCTDASRRRVRTLAFWLGDHYGPNVEYDVAGTRCEAVMANRAVFHSDDVQARFPADADLIELGARSYLAVPIHDATGAVVGHFGALDTAPMPVHAHDDWILRVFAARAGAELERLRAEERLRESEAQARHLLESNFDGIEQMANTLTGDGRLAVAFSHSAPVQSTILSVNKVAGSVSKLLAPLLGDGIRLQMRLEKDLPSIRCDRTQIEQAITNLVLNARDAMPDGGVLAIETAGIVLDRQVLRKHPEASPGPHVRLSVTDTGSGMDADTATKVFEPFFTTKEPGEGTGLGLAMVHGAVKQHGGWMTLTSAPAEGSTFALYFPVAAQGEPES